MKLSVFAVTVVGTWTAVLRACANGWGSTDWIGRGVPAWSGLDSTCGSQSSQRGISLDGSVAISEKQHQVGGFGEPPNASLRATNATEAMTMMDFAADSPA